MATALEHYKLTQKAAWARFAPVEIITIAPAAKLVAYAQIQATDRVLDVGCGTGVVAITAARTGAQVRALDLCPMLLEKARANAEISRLRIDFKEGDVEALPYDDAAFDVVVSQFGHMFAPRGEVALAEMLRVLKPGGRIAFSTWPPEMYTGRMFALVAKYLPKPEVPVTPPPSWGNPDIVRERLGAFVTDIQFERDLMVSPCLSIPHFRHFIESVGPMSKAPEILKDEPEKLAALREEFETLIGEFVDGNTVRQHFLMTRAIKTPFNQ